jgi:hypothetical protein
MDEKKEKKKTRTQVAKSQPLKIVRRNEQRIKKIKKLPDKCQGILNNSDIQMLGN